MVKKRKLSMQSHMWHLTVAQSATCPVCEMSSPWVIQSASWQSASWRICWLSTNQVTYYIACFVITKHPDNDEILAYY